MGNLEYCYCFALFFHTVPLLLGQSHSQVKNANTNTIPTDEYSTHPFATSVTYLIHLAEFEEKIYAKMRDYTKELEQRLHLIKLYMKDYEDSTLVGTGHLPENTTPLEKASAAMADPILAYRIVRRFSNELAAILDNMKKRHESKIEKLIKKLAHLPTNDDVDDAIEALLRLHYTYDLNINMFASGESEILSKPLGALNVPLTTPQVFEVAKYASQNGYFSLAKQWLDLTRDRIEIETEQTIDARELEKAHKKNMLWHDKMLKNSGTPGDLIYSFNDFLKNNPNAQDVPTVREDMLSRLPEVLSQSDDDGHMVHNWYLGHYSYLALCNGNNYQSEKYKKDLKCWYDSSRSHFYGPINPLKVELINKNPELYQIYDVVGAEWIAKLKKAAIPRLETAFNTNTEDAHEKAAGKKKNSFRTASDTWLADEDIPEIPISRKLELIMGLNVRGSMASTGLQIAMYTYGGHVDIHSDTLDRIEGHSAILDLKGDRVTTFLIYLSDVEEGNGGLTAFPGLKTFTRPVKGSAIHFDNLLKNGDVDYRMFHAACPLIRGYKWIATKWTHMNANFLKRPCHLDKDE